MQVHGYDIVRYPSEKYTPERIRVGQWLWHYVEDDSARIAQDPDDWHNKGPKAYGPSWEAAAVAAADYMHEAEQVRPKKIRDWSVRMGDHGRPEAIVLPGLGHGGFNHDHLPEFFGKTTDFSAGEHVYALVVSWSEFDSTDHPNSEHSRVVAVCRDRDEIIEWKAWVEMHRHDPPNFDKGGWQPWQGSMNYYQDSYIVFVPVI